MYTDEEKLSQAKEWLQVFHNDNAGKQNIEQVEMAIKLNEKGQYGQCMICKRPIGFAAMEAQAHLTVCMDCGLKFLNCLWNHDFKDKWNYSSEICYRDKYYETRNTSTSR